MKTKRTFMKEKFTISYENFRKGWTMPYTHFHDSYELYILESGERTVTIGDKEYKTSAHDVILLDKNIVHTSKGDTPFSGICIHIMDIYIDYYFTAQAKKLLLDCFSHTIIRLNESEFVQIRSYAEKFNVDSVDNFIVLANIMNILSTAAMRTGEKVTVKEHESLTKSKKIIKYVNDNYTSIKNVTDITDKFGVSESYVFKIFKQNFNTTPKRYIHNLRLKNICLSLENREGTIRSIAFDSGFDCYEYFIRLFKKEMGCTPSEYRQRYRKI